ncbi:DUF2069 domain-containing protein [Halomonas sp. 18H]|uniref:DUF2069 domain-containing protein n=1 Tax=Halomonas almeriensis TaxID=308163 RepID=UPI00222E6540|nr:MULTISPECIES: DUF2069 domain-containing protein [Halomonas]MCW4151888.1 DUF2069 domain-containing protein [Halomonas sp. 18H]MDN3554134.1 DUF2069 domain-containing protein [Halomonas almeriensis]
MKRWVNALEARQGLDRLVTTSRRLVIGSYAILVILMVYRGLVVDSDTGRIGPWIAFVLPLALFLPSIFARRARGHAWLAFVSLLYFAQGVMVASLPGQVIRGITEAVVALALFAACTGYARFRSRQVKNAQAGSQ